MNNKKLGNQFERELGQTLFNHRFWVYHCPNKTVGQPVDIIASRNGHPCLIDAKVCANDVFDTRRIEENQENAMFLWAFTGNEDGYFALKMSDGEVFMVKTDALLMARQLKKILHREDIELIGEPFSKWVSHW